MLRHSFSRVANTQHRFYALGKPSILSDLKYLYFSPVWPQPNGSAAGVRNYDILTMLRNLTNNSQKYKLIKSRHVKKIHEYASQKHENDDTQVISQQIVYVTPQHENEHSRYIESEFQKRVDVLRINPNTDGELLESLLKDYQPDVAIFDTFIAEEFYSWHIFRHAPECIRIVDTQDLRSMRKFREEQLAIADSVGQELPQTQLIQARPNILNNELLARELASLHRSDYNFVVSSFEKDMLVNEMKFPQDKLGIAPFYYDNTIGQKPSWFPTYHERKDFVFIGTFTHSPNVDAVMFLKQIIWPTIRRAIPDAQLHIYGSHAKQAHLKLTDESQGFIVHGQLDNLIKLKEYRVNLAPLRFGAGIKGKISDGWYHGGLPCVTTLFGQEGMADNNLFGGLVATADNIGHEFAQLAIQLYTKEELWQEKQMQGFHVLNKLFDKDQNRKNFEHQLTSLVENISTRRTQDFVGNIMWQSNVRATEYMSKFIELKQRIEAKPSKK